MVFGFGMHGSDLLVVMKVGALPLCCQRPKRKERVQRQRTRAKEKRLPFLEANEVVVALRGLKVAWYGKMQPAMVWTKAKGACCFSFVGSTSIYLN